MQGAITAVKFVGILLVSGNLLIILCQLSKFQASSLKTYKDNLAYKILKKNPRGITLKWEITRTRKNTGQLFSH